MELPEGFLKDFFRERRGIFSNKKNLKWTINTNKWYKYKQRGSYNSFIYMSFKRSNKFSSSSITMFLPVFSEIRFLTLFLALEKAANILLI